MLPASFLNVNIKKPIWNTYIKRTNTFFLNPSLHTTQLSPPRKWRTMQLLYSKLDGATWFGSPAGLLQWQGAQEMWVTALASVLLTMQERLRSVFTCEWSAATNKGAYLCLLRIFSSLASSAVWRPSVEVRGQTVARYCTSWMCWPGRYALPLPWL